MAPSTATTPVWFITGASAGFGKCFAEYALDRGYRVVATARTPSKCDALATPATADRLLVVALDVTKPETIGPAVDAAIARFGRIDVLINNAGFGVVGAVEETPEADMRAIMETNFFGAYLVTQRMLPVMRDQGAGAVVQIASMLGSMSIAGLGAYSASKFALEGLSEALAQEVTAFEAPRPNTFGVKVLIVEPGAFRTDFAGAALKHMPKIDDAYETTVGGTRAFCASVDQTQMGDPVKAARAIDDAIAADKTPLRLVLGPDAVDAVRGHAETQLQEIQEWEDVARAAVFPPSDAA